MVPGYVFTDSEQEQPVLVGVEADDRRQLSLSLTNIEIVSHFRYVAGTWWQRYYFP